MRHSNGIRIGLAATLAVGLLGHAAAALAQSSAECAFVSETRTRIGDGSTSEGSVGSNSGRTTLGRHVTVEGTDTAVFGDNVGIGNGSSVCRIESVNPAHIGRNVTVRCAMVRGATGGTDGSAGGCFIPPVVDCGGESITVAKGHTQAIPAGTHGALTLANGAKVTLEPGAHTFCGINAGRNVVITVNGSGPVDVKGDVILGNGSRLAPPSASDAPVRLRVRGNVLVGAGSTLIADIAAGGRLMLGRGVDLTGSACADVIATGRRVHFSCSEVTPPTSTTTTTPTTSSTSSSSSSTSTPTTSSSSTSSTLTCNHNGHVDPGEQCDDDLACHPSSASSAFGALVDDSSTGGFVQCINCQLVACNPNSTTVPTTTSTQATTSSTTQVTTTSTTVPTTTSTVPTTSSTAASTTTTSTTEATTTSTTEGTTSTTEATIPTTTSTTVTTIPTTVPTTTPTTSSSTTSSSTSSTSTSSTTVPTTTLPKFLDFTTKNRFADACGAIFNATSGGTKLADLHCGGLSIGGGSSTVNEGPTPDGSITRIGVGNCTGTTCDIQPVANTGDPLIDCSVTGCPFGTPLPIPNLGTTTCVVNTLSADVSGSVDLATGTASNFANHLASATYLTGTPTEPCPVCTVSGLPASPSHPLTGTCDRGLRKGLACTTTNSTGLTKDCLPCDSTTADPAKKCPANETGQFQLIGSIPVDLVLSTSQVVKTKTGDVTSGATTKAVFCPGQAFLQGGCFKAGGPTCQRYELNGSPAGSLLTPDVPKDVVLASGFCVAKTNNFTIDFSANLPGPGATTLVGTLTPRN